MHHRRAFTLIELLVVIAIIAILAAILFPVFSQAKMAAKKTVAMANAKQIATANEIYMGDYDDRLIKEFFGFPADGVSWGSTYYNWRYAMRPYTKSDALLQDTTNPFQDKRFWTFAWGNGAQPDVYLPSNFAVNNHVIGFANGWVAGPWTPPGLDSLSQLDEPANTILMLPNRSQWNDLKWYFGSLTWIPASDTSWCITPQGGSTPVCPAAGNGPIHAVGKQVAWIWGDTHAKPRAYNQTLAPNDPNRDDWYAYGSVDPATGNKYSWAQRQAAAQNLWPLSLIHI